MFHFPAVCVHGSSISNCRARSDSDADETQHTCARLFLRVVLLLPDCDDEFHLPLYSDQHTA